MIPRYSRPRDGAIWEPENYFRIQLEIEAYACEAQAELGVIPESAARAVRERGAFEVERIREIEREVASRDDRLSDQPRRACRSRGALSAPGHDLERRARHLPCGAAEGGGRPAARRSRRAAGGAEAARLRAQIHADGRPQPRHPCRADDLWPEARRALRRIRPQPRAASSPRARRSRPARFPARSAPSPISTRRSRPMSPKSSASHPSRSRPR